MLNPWPPLGYIGLMGPLDHVFEDVQHGVVRSVADTMDILPRGELDDVEL